MITYNDGYNEGYYVGTNILTRRYTHIYIHILFINSLICECPEHTWSHSQFPVMRNYDVTNYIQCSLRTASLSEQTLTRKTPRNLAAPYSHIVASSYNVHMMASSNGNIIRVTGPLCGEFTGHRWIPLTKASDTELSCFLWSAPEQTIE